MAALAPPIHDLREISSLKSWMAGIRPAMTWFKPPSPLLLSPAVCRAALTPPVTLAGPSPAVTVRVPPRASKLTVGAYYLAANFGRPATDAAFFCSATQVSKSACDTAFTEIGMRLWFWPQIWLHSP